MARTRMRAMLVIDPTTGQPPEDWRGRSVLVAAEGTSTPLQLTYDRDGLLPMPNPVQITPQITTPQMYLDDGILTADLVSGSQRIGIESAQASTEAALAALALARAASLAAAQSASLVNAPPDSVIAQLLAAPDSQTRLMLTAILLQSGGGAGGGGSVDEPAVRAIVNDALAEFVGAAPAAFDTFTEIATAFGNDPQAVGKILTRLTATEGAIAERPRRVIYTAVNQTRPADKFVEWIGVLADPPANGADNDTWTQP